MVERDKLYSVSELAQAFSLTPQALRFYEGKGLLQPARSGRARVYTYRDRARLELIQRLQRLGFTLEDISEYIAMYGAKGGEQFEFGLGKIQRRLDELRRLKVEIDQTIGDLESLEQEALHKLAAARDQGA